VVEPASVEVPRNFELPDQVAQWDDMQHFTFLQEHQFGHLALLEDLKAKGRERTDEHRHWLAQFEKVEMHMAGDFNRRYFQG
tara:strand:- start:208 stop:453 length:246 start_codon:yes stop_codon:yes gene_type:complete